MRRPCNRCKKWYQKNGKRSRICQPCAEKQRAIGRAKAKITRAKKLEQIKLSLQHEELVQKTNVVNA